MIRRFGRLIRIAAGVGVVATPFLIPSLIIHGESSDSKANALSQWRKETIGEYENRIRAFSHPFKKKGRDRYMTVNDLIRSLIPYRPGAPENPVRTPSAEIFFQYADMNDDGLIGFPEYIVFLTLLGTPEYHWKISFKLFDINGDGTVSQAEFERIMNHATSELAVGHRMGSSELDHLKFKNTGLNRLFFDLNGEKSLTFDEFSDFMRRLNLEVLKLEFNQLRADEKIETISLKDFGRAILNFVKPSDFSKYQQRLERIPESDERITFQQYRRITCIAVNLFAEFDQMVRTRLHDIETAYKFYSAMSHNGFTREDFGRIIKSVTTCSLTEGQVDAIFKLFDVNDDGILQSREFYEVLKARRDRGINNPKDTSLKTWVESVITCVKTSD